MGLFNRPYKRKKEYKNQCQICKRHVRELIYVGTQEICDKCFEACYEEAKRKRSEK